MQLEKILIKVSFQIVTLFLIVIFFKANALAQQNLNDVITYKSYDNYLKSGENFLICTNSFEPLVYVEQIRQFGISPYIENESAFLDLTPSQSEDFVVFIKKMADVAWRLRSSYRTINYIKKESDLEKYKEELKILEEEWGQIPQSLLEIFGPAKYRRFLDYVLFQKSCALCDPDNEEVFKNSFFYTQLAERLKISIKNSNLTGTQLEKVKDEIAKDYFNFYKINYDLKVGATSKLMRSATTHLNEKPLVINASSNNISDYQLNFEKTKKDITALIKDSVDKKVLSDEFGIDLE